MDTPYYEIIHLIERLHRQFLDVLKVELERAGIHDINNVQSLVLHNIGDDEMTVGELTIRGYYLGSNVSYNVKKMVENGYLIQERSVHDKRSLRVHLSEKGRDLNNALSGLYETHEEMLAELGFPQDALAELNNNLKSLEKFWSSQMTGGSLRLEKTGTE